MGLWALSRLEDSGASSVTGAVVQPVCDDAPLTVQVELGVGETVSYPAETIRHRRVVAEGPGEVRHGSVCRR